MYTLCIQDIDGTNDGEITVQGNYYGDGYKTSSVIFIYTLTGIYPAILVDAYDYPAINEVCDNADGSIRTFVLRTNAVLSEVPKYSIVSDIEISSERENEGHCCNPLLLGLGRYAAAQYPNTEPLSAFLNAIYKDFTFYTVVQSENDKIIPHFITCKGKNFLLLSTFTDYDDYNDVSYKSQIVETNWSSYIKSMIISDKFDGVLFDSNDPFQHRRLLLNSETLLQKSELAVA